MQRVSVTEATVFFSFHSIRVIFLFFSGVVVSLSALGASQYDTASHDYSSN